MTYGVNLGANGEKYFSSITKVLATFESDHSIRINPEKYPQIAIKVETGLAPGLQTSKGLLDGILEFLKVRGFEKQNIIIFDKDKDGLKSRFFIWQRA